MTLGAGLAVVFALGWVLIYVFRVEGWSESLPAYRGAERVWVQLTPVLLAGHTTAACVLLQRSATLPTWSVALGLAVYMVALAFWFWGRLQIGPLRVRRLPDEPPRQLRRDGAFGIVRHPLYLSYVLAVAAPTLVLRRGWLWLSFGLCVIAVAMRAVQEERRLHVLVGPSYAAYCREVKRLVPFVW